MVWVSALKAQKIIAGYLWNRSKKVSSQFYKYDVNLSGANLEKKVLSNLQEAMTALIPFMKQQGLYDYSSQKETFIFLELLTKAREII